MKRVNQGLALMMSLLLCATSFNFSLIANAKDSSAARIIGFNQLDESINGANVNVDTTDGMQGIMALIQPLKHYPQNHHQAIRMEHSMLTMMLICFTFIQISSLNM